ncbi:MAG: DinB family protein [Kofleriaceae bacterium]|nr:DinB family protein [Kofleriaceae bacterium]
MMTLEWVRALARYNRWMNDKLYALAATLPDEVRKRDSGAFFKSIHGTFNHLLVADRIWLGRLTGVTLADGFLGPGIRALDQELYADFDELRRERARTDADLLAWVAELTDAQLGDTLAFVRLGVKQEVPRWWAVAQVFNHQTHHRGQLTTLFMQQGHDPGVTDLYAMLREERA